jgi:hypothetical protein
MRRLGDALGETGVERAFAELTSERELLDDIEGAVADVDHFRRKRWDSVLELGVYRLVAYCLTRAIKPTVFVETGVLHGLTSHFILTALRRNQAGRLISVDLPSFFETGPPNRDGFLDTLPPDKEPGWVIPAKNRAIWQLVLGPSLASLPAIFEREAPIDVFLHDSEHTVATMTGEFELAWPCLRRGGVLIADNIDANNSFADFCSSVNRTPTLFPDRCTDASASGPARFGLIVK